MQINITGHQLDLTPSLRAYVENKFKRLRRHSEHINHTHVILSIEKARQRAEATVQVNRGSLFAEEQHEDMYAAIDGLIDKLDRQLKKHKEKLSNHRGESSIKAGAPGRG